MQNLKIGQEEKITKCFSQLIVGKKCKFSHLVEEKYCEMSHVKKDWKICPAGAWEEKTHRQLFEKKSMKFIDRSRENI